MRKAPALFACLLALSCSTGTGTLQFFDFRVIVPPGGVAAAYGRIENHTDEDLILTGISSTDFGSAQAHRTIEESGHVRMEPVSNAKIPAGASLVFEPGSLHIMLMEPRETFKPGSIVSIKITLNHRDYELEMPVREIGR